MYLIKRLKVKISELRDVLRELIFWNFFFCNSLEKNDFNAIGFHLVRVQSHLKELDF